MAVGSNFDQWQKDVFFSAAEEVQESADALESLYRMWMRNNKDGLPLVDSDELHRELYTALGTAKWQLEEFEKAVRLSHESYPSEENAVARHKQFIAAIGNQIYGIEKAFREEVKHPLRWVQLDAKEQDDLARFLSAGRDKSSDCNKCTSHEPINPPSVRSFKKTIVVSNDASHVVEVATREPLRRKDNEGCTEVEQLNSLRRTSSSLDTSAWKIAVADDIDVDSKSVEVKPEMPNHASRWGLLKSVEPTKLRWLRNNFVKAKSEEYLQLRHGLSNYLDLHGVVRLAQGISRLTGRGRSCFNSSNEDVKPSSSQQLAARSGGFSRQIPGTICCVFYVKVATYSARRRLLVYMNTDQKRYTSTQPSSTKQIPNSQLAANSDAGPTGRNIARANR